MATIPPPIPPQEAARRAREAWRAQAAAQKAQYRAQKQYWRSMRRPSITGPFVLILIGVMALLLLTGKINGATFWIAYQHWWPLLFIVVGLGMLLEWFLDRDKPYPVRRTSGGLDLPADTCSGGGHIQLGALELGSVARPVRQ